MDYECIIIGGGIAGMQAAIQLGRYEHKVLVIDAGVGRSTICGSYRNVLGWPDGISGTKLRQIGREQAQSLGVSWVTDEAIDVCSEDGHFIVRTKEQGTYKTVTLLLATGVMDRFPELPNLRSCLGSTVYVCPDCDGYEVKNKRTIVLGSGDTGANMAVTLSCWTDKMIYVNHEKLPICSELHAKLSELQIEVIAEPIEQVLCTAKGIFSGIRLANGCVIAGERGFIAFGGNEVRSTLASRLRIERLENKHIVVDPRTKMTNVPHVWAAGDVCAHAEQLTIAMGEGAQAAIWIHKTIVNVRSANEDTRHHH
ncbi:NAD(P)/FAD-dependent oxidoreductase [Paenibacillus sp. UMB4589-SE434]|uniref:NAD(P)/FAD-dependent oxidoreductase n=1 Tax=Paenibacillus sp. UMB4589-SE434 TaxID=3046314 RepID=UPI002550A31C|nr:NAD(P)/FAD-dependent oxidoreductase [Paenibacillus sp. UMB4589-SE434]MDK8179792.1 NAD(P)/FAD-dependent oxidoreductase [Paenibacillus sp. UMB4589-SE434]